MEKRRGRIAPRFIEKIDGIRGLLKKIRDRRPVNGRKKGYSIMQNVGKPAILDGPADSL